MSENIQIMHKVVGARANFVRLKTPESFGDTEPSYKVTLSFDIADPAQKAEASSLNKAILGLAAKRWPKPDEQKRARTGRPLLRQGSDDDKSFKAGTYFIATRNTPGRDHPIVMVDAQCKPVGPDVFYSGCYVNAMLEIYTWDNKSGKGMSARLTHLQFKRDGEPLGAGSAPATAESVFGAEDGLAGDDLDI